MSLHGTIQVNGQIIGGWSAQRGRALAPGEFEYDVVLSEHFRRLETKLTHRHADGAAILASKILALRPPDWPVPPIYLPAYSNGTSDWRRA